MKRSIAGVMSILRSGSNAGVRVGVHLRIALITLLITSWSQLALAATPPGTIISNTANITYTADGVPGRTLASNTDQFTVASTAPVNSAVMTLGAFSNRLYAGTTHTIALDLTNDGSNALASHRIRITAPLNSQIALTGTGVTLVSNTSNATTSTSLYRVPDLATNDTQNFQVSLTLPMPVEPSDNRLTVEHLANGATINSQMFSMTLINRTRGVLEIMQYSHSSAAVPVIISPTLYKGGDGNFAPTAVPELPDAPGVLVTAAPVSLEVTDKFSHQQTLFMRVIDPDQNLDSSVKERIVVNLKISDSGEVETLQLLETGPDTSLFTGYAILEKDTPSSNDGHLDIHPHSALDLNYSDGIDRSDSNTSIILIDPYGQIFDSATGQKLDGYTVQMINADTGLPAEVYGDDGVTSYPATMTTGSAVTDGGGHVYTYGAGEYRFPFAPAANYKLVVTVPNGAKYVWPSTKSTELLYKLPIDNLEITLGSRGETFPLIPGPPLHIDIPVDPLTTQMYIQRSANRESVAAGDFIRYSVSLENITPVALNGVVLTETLPRGFRLREGSVVINDAIVADPAISADGTTLTFDFGAMASGEIKSIEYVVAIGAVKQGAVASYSHAIANSGAAESNRATHEARIFDELMRDRAVLMGQIIVDDSGDQAAGNNLSGLRLYMEDGRYAITDERGMFHFDNVIPGSHVVQLDLDTLPEEFEVIPTEKNTRFAGRAWSQFVDVQGGTLWRTDFHIARKPAPTGNLSLQISNQAILENGDVTYTIGLQATTVDVSNMRLTAMIPEGTHYKPGSSTFGGQAVEDPAIVGDKMLTWRLGDSTGDGNGDWSKGLSFTVSGAHSTGVSELITKSYMLFDTPAKSNQRLPVTTHLLVLAAIEGENRTVVDQFLITPNYRLGSAALNADDKLALDRFAEQLKGLKNIRIHAIGHTDNIPLERYETITTYGDNYRLSEFRAHEVAQHLRKRLQLPPEKITIEGKGPDQPLISNATPEGRAANRRVQLYIYSDIQTEPGHATSTETQSEKQTMAIEGLRPGSDKAATPAAPEKKEQPNYDGPWLANQNAEIEWLLPAAAEIPAIPSANITIKHHIDQKVRLTLNGEAVPEVNFNGALKNNKGPALSNWSGVDLIEGDNLFRAVIIAKDGRVVSELTRNLHYSSDPVRAEIVAEKSTLIADGKSNPVIAIRLYDKDNYPVHKGHGVEYSLNHPFQPMRNSEFITDNMAGAPGNRTFTTVGDNGIALITLEPSNDTDDLVITLPFANNKSVELKTRLKAKARDWILVGLAEGTAGHNTISGNMEPLEGNAAQEHFYRDDRLAFFAKGRVLGKWLLTMAYDSDKELPKKQGNDPRLFQAIDPGTYYTVYGDAGQNGFGATSSDKLYLKLERDEFYLLYGDYETGFKGTKLAKYERTLTGIKTRYQDEKYNLILFTSESNQAFVKDEFRGQSSTGPYRLSRTNVAMNSEKVTIEARDRFRSDVIVSSRELARHSDYDINYRDGSITFREPVFSTDERLNPQFIVVKYESYDGSDTSITSGGRAEVKVNDRLRVGVTEVTEGRTGGDAQLVGSDVQYQLSDNTQVRLEAARTYDKKETNTTLDGNAWLAEVEHQTKRSSNKLYLQETDSQFGLGQTNASENGMRKGGVETTVHAADNLNVKGQAYRQENTATNATRDLAEAQGEYTLGNTRLRAGLREVQDERGDGSQQKSEQITTGISQNMLDNRLTLRADREVNLNHGNDSIDFPDKTKLGADYRITQNTTLFAEQEIANGEIRDTRSSRAGVKSTPWNGGEIYSGLTRTSSDAGSATSANVAARQKWQLSQAWSLDVGAEESKTLSQTQGTPFNLNTGFANGAAEDFTAGSIGLTYTQESWMWSGRAESRNSDLSDSRHLATSLQTTPKSNLSMLAALSLTQSDSASGTQQKATDVQLGLAYRPIATKWLLLDKLELIKEESSSAADSQESWRIINLFNANYKTGRWQTSFQYGAKSVKETLNRAEYSQFVDLTGIETRYDVTPEWDVGVHGNVLHAWTMKQYNYNSGLSIGHTLAENIWFSLGYNFVGFRDRDFSRVNYTSRGAFMRFRMKFDQHSVKEGLRWLKK